MEPDERYDAFIKPLVDKSGSKYRHTRMFGAHPRSYWNNYHKLLSEGELMTPRPPLPLDDLKMRQLDTNILLTGNLARSTLDNGRSSSVALAPLILQHFGAAALANDVVHRSGLVKMLWWMPEQYKRLAAPVSSRKRFQFSASLETAAQIDEVAGVEPIELIERDKKVVSLRAPAISVMVHERVKAAMASAGIKPPARRALQPLGITAPEHEVAGLADHNPLETTMTTLAEVSAGIDALTKHVEDSHAAITSASGYHALSAVLDDCLTRIHYPSALLPVSTFETSKASPPKRKTKISPSPTEKAEKRSHIVADNILRQIHLEASYFAVADLHPNHPDLPALSDKLWHLDEKFAALHEDIEGHKNTPITRAKVADIQRALIPNRMARDARTIEPLQATPEEFWPRIPLSLVSLTPHTRDLGVADIASRKVGAKVSHELLRQLLANSATSVPAQLDRVAFGAAKDLIPQVPALRDPRRGGRFNPRRLDCRGLTPEMVEGLVKAWLEWPFKPEMWLMEAAGEAVGEAEEAGEGEGEGVDEEEA